ncbi:unnamed protein product [Urochloa humidicola]
MVQMYCMCYLCYNYYTPAHISFASNIPGYMSDAASECFHYTKVQVPEMLYPALIAEILFSSKRLIQAASFVEIKTKFVTSINHLQIPWDPGGIDRINRLGGKPSLKKGGMLGMFIWRDRQMWPDCELELGKSTGMICVLCWAGLGRRACRHKRGVAHVFSLYAVERGKERDIKYYVTEHIFFFLKEPALMVP